MTELSLRHTEAPAGLGFHRLVPEAAAVPGSAACAIGDAAGIELELVTDLAAFHALEAEWNALFDASATPGQVFQSYAWCWHWSRHYLDTSKRGGVKLAIATGRIRGKLVIVLPLALEHRGGLRQLVWLGEPVSQYGDLLASPEASDPEVLLRAWRFVAARTGADLANLRKVRADSLAAGMLRRIGTTVTAEEEAPCIDLTRWDGFNAFEEALPGKGRRKNRRRQMRRLEERGPVTFEVHAGTDDAAHLADYAVRLKRAWLKSRDYISPALADDRFASFFADVAHGRGKDAGVKVLAVRTNGEIGALDIVVDGRQGRCLHIAVFAPKFEKAGAGALLLENAIARCFDDGIRAFDMLAPKHDYKLDYTETVVRVEDHAIALTVKGRAWTGGFLAFRRRLKAGVEAMPAPARRVLAATLRLAKGGARSP